MKLNEEEKNMVRGCLVKSLRYKNPCNSCFLNNFNCNVHCNEKVAFDKSTGRDLIRKIDEDGDLELSIDLLLASIELKALTNKEGV